MNQGANFESIFKLSLASAPDIGTGEDFMIAATIDSVGRARRFLGLSELPLVVGAVKSLLLIRI